MKICKVEKKREVVDVYYEVCENNYCCKKMKQWLSIQTYYRHNLRYDTKMARFNICVRRASDYDDVDDGHSEASYEDLNYCPFCGKQLQEPIVKKPKRKSWIKKK